MHTDLTRRQLLRTMAAAGLGAAFARRTVAEELPPLPPGRVPVKLRGMLEELPAKAAKVAVR